MNGAVLPGPFNLSYGSTVLSLGINGTVLGGSGTSVTLNAPSLDGTAIRFALTGANYAVPSGVSLVRFTQTSSIGPNSAVAQRSRRHPPHRIR